uniref:Thioredoxin domain-containing protein n=1 Tax=Hemiselmis andersenii TaxID=464988 RepID=A0A6U5BAK1_HEMAN|mmetsp:Transcript_38762/g.90365  ORF Transcript_38762/g.90365 Transcript_38762/m.90365 type:complete len:248 (+) Transcript_38762:166-909(+)
MPTYEQLKGEAQLGALEGALHAAVRDYKKEMMDGEEAAKQRQKEANTKEVDLLDDEDLDELHAQRIREMKAEAMRRQEMAKKGHGQYVEIREDQFLQEVTTCEKAVVHFFHQDFQRCKIVHKHLQAVAPKYAECKFLKLNAQEAPFFVTKLQIQVLPCIVMFKKGIACDRIVGFEELGGVDDFTQIRLERRLTEQGIIAYKNDDIDSDEEQELRERKGIKGGALYEGSKYKKAFNKPNYDSDEDEDW